MPEHRRKAHKRHMPYMAVQMAAGLLHAITAHARKHGVTVTSRYLRHQGGGVHVAGRFACYEEILRQNANT
jgi:hypothetical protein